MKKYLRYVSLLTMVVTAVACAPRAQSTQVSLSEIIVTDSISRKFNLQLDFMKHHFSGMLIARRMRNDEVRLLFTTYFGLSVFDFSLKGDSLYVNSCIEPMRKVKLLRILEHDFKQVFLPGENLRIKKKSAIFEKRISGKGIGKTVISLSEFQDNHPQRIQIKHPWIRLKIQFDKLR